jgi:hypothetical protein
MKSILLRSLSLNLYHTVDISIYPTVQKDEILFIYDGVDTIGWGCVEELITSENKFLIKVLNLSFDNE